MTLYIIGAGLSGLSAALAAVDRGWPVVIFESSTQAGGRCRSFHDSTIKRNIDNGNHLILGANTETLAYLDRIGAQKSLLSISPAEIPFIDLRNSKQWTLRPGPPWWPVHPTRGVPDAKIIEFLKAGKLFFSKSDTTVAQCLPPGNLFERFWSPLVIATLNTTPQFASARLLSSVVKPLLFGGERANRLHIARNGLSQAFVDPAVVYIESNGGILNFGSRLRAINVSANKVVRLLFDDTDIALQADDRVILAVPPQSARLLFPKLTVPQKTCPIVNAHYLLNFPISLPGCKPIIGIIGGTAHWLFVRDDMIAVTVSAADHLVNKSTAEIAKILWTDVARVIGHRNSVLPAYKIIKEKRATFAQTPVEILQRPSSNAMGLTNLILAGDWTATGLPATIESSIRSGQIAVEALAVG